MGMEMITIEASVCAPLPQTPVELCKGHVDSIKGGDALAGGHPAAAMTVIRKRGPLGIDYTLCSASGRAASRTRETSDGHIQYFHDYFTLGSVPL